MSMRTSLENRGRWELTFSFDTREEVDQFQKIFEEAFADYNEKKRKEVDQKPSGRKGGKVQKQVRENSVADSPKKAGA